jgi:L-histidine Nalpha-methyltransferase
MSSSSVIDQTQHLAERLHIEELVNPHAPSAAELHPGSDVVQGLSQTPKTLPARYFYDDYGSELFEQICDLPEYYLTRTETEIFRRCAAELVQITGACELVELGSGSSTKTRLLLDAYEQAGLPLRYGPIDISAGILASSAQQLLQDYPTLQVQGRVGTYELALDTLEPSPLGRRMISFIGSTLGNLDPVACEAFLNRVIHALQPGDFFLLGIDLQKPRTILEAAYNDAAGVTAQFNLNMLRHLNRRFDGNFDLDQFTHRAIYNEARHQIEMHLYSQRAQQVTLNQLNLTLDLAAGESILSEISRKFDLTKMEHHLELKGLQLRKTWVDPQRWFGLVLSQYIP